MDKFSKALNLSYFYLKFRPRTRKELLNFLYKKSRKHRFTKKIIEDVIEDLEGQELIDDAKFVEWFIRSRSNLKPKSKFLMKRELLSLGISNDLIKKYLEDAQIDEDKLARDALSKKWRRWRNLPEQERFTKAVSFLLRRGFSYSLSKRAVEEIEKTG